MPRYQKPRSHSERIYFLDKASVTGQLDIDAGRFYMSQSTVDAINSMLPNYKSAFNAIPAAAANRSKNIREKNETLANLSLYTRDIWEQLRRRVRRNHEPPEVLQYYGLPLNGISPSTRLKEDWLGFATTCITGDAAAVAAGYPAMVSPSSAELNVVLATAIAETDDVALADHNLDFALQNAEAFIEQADYLIKETMAELRFNTRKLDASSQRRIQRTYGARFRAYVGENSDNGQHEIIAIADGQQSEFTSILIHIPIEKGSVKAGDGLEEFSEQNTDNNDIAQLTGSNGGTGSLEFATGIIILHFHSPPSAEAIVAVNYLNTE